MLAAKMHPLVLILGLLKLLALPVDAASQSRILAESALYNAATDPFGRVDPFPRLTPAQLEQWAREDAGSLEDKLKILDAPLECSLSVEVKLVGFSADGHFGINLGERDFAPYLEALKADVIAHVMEAENHTLPVKTKLFYRFTQSAHHLAGTLQNAIHKAVEEAPKKAHAGENDPVTISYKTVDDILAADFQKGELAYTIYVLNPTAASKKYLYHYDQEGKVNGCASPLWIAKERYLWVDLTAAPTTYGPHSSGDGILLESSLPRPEMPRYHTGSHYKRLVADILAMVQSASEHLLTPPAMHSDLRFFDYITVQIIRIVDVAITAEDLHAEPPGLGIEALRRELAGLTIGTQQINVKIKTVSFTHCDMCVAAYYRALSTFARSIPWRPPGPDKPHPSEKTRRPSQRVYEEDIHEFLDSLEMHGCLQEFAFPRLWEEAGIDPPPPEVTRRGVYHKTLPVYLFDMETEDQLLFDRQHQVVSFPDMVLAVRSRAGETFVDFKCGREVVRMHPHNIARPLLAAVLETLWGVAATSLTWSAADNAPVRNHMWAVGLTPFGHLGVSDQLSFVQKDVALRNMVNAHINATMASTKFLLERFQRFGHGEAPLSREASKLFSARWNVFQYKLSRAARTAAVHNFNASLYFVLSSAHDVGAISQILHDAAGEIHTSMKCHHDPEVPLEWHLIFIVLMGILIYMCTRIKRHNKPKLL